MNRQIETNKTKYINICHESPIRTFGLQRKLRTAKGGAIILTQQLLRRRPLKRSGDCTAPYKTHHRETYKKSHILHAIAPTGALLIKTNRGQELPTYPYRTHRVYPQQRQRRHNYRERWRIFAARYKQALYRMLTKYAPM